MCVCEVARQGHGQLGVRVWHSGGRDVDFGGAGVDSIGLRSHQGGE